jgi:hypothetical protein
VVLLGHLAEEMVLLATAEKGTLEAELMMIAAYEVLKVMSP